MGIWFWTSCARCLSDRQNLFWKYNTPHENGVSKFRITKAVERKGYCILVIAAYGYMQSRAGCGFNIIESEKILQRMCALM